MLTDTESFPSLETLRTTPQTNRCPLMLKFPANLIILAKEASTSGKYVVFFGEHYVKGIPCYDTGAYNGLTKRTTRRHYKNKAEALRYYDEFRDKMIAKPESEETDETEKYVVN